MTPGGIAPGTWLPEMDYALGTPLADAVYSHPTWTRSFGSAANPTRVTFDAIKGTGTISWARGRGRS